MIRKVNGSHVYNSQIMPELFTLESLYEELGIALAAAQENERLRKDRDYWKAEYQRLLNETIKHNEKVTGNMLLLALGRPEEATDAQHD